MRPRALLPVLMIAAVVAGWAAEAAAQTPFVPYYGKNNIHYDKFDWHIYTTDHFEIFYYPELEQHLERVAGYAESAYQQISSDLKHDLSTKVQLILFKTHSEFEQENVDPSAGQEGVGAFAEPTQHRMVMPIDAPPDQLYGLIVHELTHQFEFDIIPQGLVRRNVPLWVNEGLSEYERGQWTPFDLMMVRDAAISDIVPKMTETEAYGGNNARFVPYNLGHAVFEFIEAKYGKEGVRQFVFALRKSVIGGGEDAYEEALKMKKDEFDQAFERYLKDRFKPFRDKERPADYGRDLAPNKEKTKYIEAISITASPSGDLLAVMTFNRRDGEIDVILVSTKDGSIVRNLTDGFDKDMGFDHIIQNGERPEMPWMSWSPKGDRLAYFVRTNKERALLIQNVLTKKIEVRIPMTTVDEPESPAFSPDGQTVAFSGLRKAVGDIFTVNLATKEVVNVTNDNFADFAPTYSPDGKYIIYNARVSGNQKLFRLDLDTKKKTQITFGTDDETDAKFIDDHTIVFSSTATDPNLPPEPDVAKNGHIYNIWTLDLKNGEMRQYTDAVGGNWSAVVLNEGQTNRIAFVSYYKGDYTLHTLERKEPLHTAASSDFGSPSPNIIDFQPPLQHTLVTDNMRKKKMFEKMFLEGRPPVNVGVTSQGDVFGGTAVTFGDVLGDKQINFTAASIAQYRTFALSYVNIGQRFQYALQGYSQTIFYYGQLGGLFYDPSFAPFISHDQAQSTQTIRGGSVIGIYPFNRFNRVELSAGFMNIDQQFNDPNLQAISTAFQEATTGQNLTTSGSMVPLSLAFVRETTVFREYGPLAGSTARVAYEYAPGVGGGLLSRRTFDVDARHYLRIGSNGVFATRIRGFRSDGDFPGFMYFGGNADLRGYDYYQFVGQNVIYANAELRFPIIEAALTPIGVVGGVRGVFFAGAGGAWFSNQQSQNPCNGEANGFKFFNSNSELCQVTLGVKTDALGNPLFTTDPKTGLQAPQLITGTQQISGFRLQDGRASYGLGLETFLLGFPIHFDWSWRTLFNKDWENVVFACTSVAANGSCISTADEFRKPRFAVWIGYDF